MNEQLIKHKGKHYLQREEGYYQIYSSTDKSLGLPSPSKEFIQKYIDKRNSGSPIEEVMVEMDRVFPIRNLDGMFMQDAKSTIMPKVNKEGNIIIISRVEETWDDVWVKWRDTWDIHHQNYEAWLEKNYLPPTKLTK